MRLLFYLAVWRRPEITEICFMGIDRLRKTGLYPIDTLAVISEESMKPLCEKYNIDYVEHENQPLGKKKNFGLKESFKKDWDYMVELGSDDLLKNEYLHGIKDFKGDLACVDHFAYINSETSEARTYKTKSYYGLGRMVKRSVAEKIGNLWPENQNRGLDNGSMYYMVTVHGVRPQLIKFDHPVGIDIKSKENLWPYNPESGKGEDFENVLKGLSEQEKTAIRCLSKKAM